LKTADLLGSLADVSSRTQSLVTAAERNARLRQELRKTAEGLALPLVKAAQPAIAKFAGGYSVGFRDEQKREVLLDGSDELTLTVDKVQVRGGAAEAVIAGCGTFEVAYALADMLAEWERRSSETERELRSRLTAVRAMRRALQGRTR